MPTAKRAPRNNKKNTQKQQQPADGPSPSSTSANEGPCCACCGAELPKTLWCSRCHKAAYCSQNCQRQHWPSHKGECFSPKEERLRKKVARATTSKHCERCQRAEGEGGKKLRKCPCKYTRYCSVECQTEDWPRHKWECEDWLGEQKLDRGGGGSGGSGGGGRELDEKSRTEGDSGGGGRAGRTRSALFPAQVRCQEAAVEAKRCAKKGNRWGEGRAYTKMGRAHQELGQFHKAIEMHEKTLVSALEVGDRAVEGIAYANLGWAYYRLGQFHKAIEMQEKELDLEL